MLFFVFLIKASLVQPVWVLITFLWLPIILTSAIFFSVRENACYQYPFQFCLFSEQFHWFLFFSYPFSLSLFFAPFPFNSPNFHNHYHIFFHFYSSVCSLLPFLSSFLFFSPLSLISHVCPHLSTQLFFSCFPIPPLPTSHSLSPPLPSFPFFTPFPHFSTFSLISPVNKLNFSPARTLLCFSLPLALSPPPLTSPLTPRKTNLPVTRI